MTEEAAGTPQVDNPEPDYANLSCPECGNKEYFQECALRFTVQDFTLKDGEPDYEAFDYGDDTLPYEVRCDAEVGDGKGNRTGATCSTVVWSARVEFRGDPVGSV